MERVLFCRDRDSNASARVLSAMKRNRERRGHVLFALNFDPNSIGRVSAGGSGPPAITYASDRQLHKPAEDDGKLSAQHRVDARVVAESVRDVETSAGLPRRAERRAISRGARARGRLHGMGSPRSATEARGASAKREGEAGSARRVGAEREGQRAKRGNAAVADADAVAVADADADAVAVAAARNQRAYEGGRAWCDMPCRAVD